MLKGVWRRYVASTFDGGKTWKTSNVTGADQVQRNSVCTNGTTCGNNRNVLDFIDATIDVAGYRGALATICPAEHRPADVSRRRPAALPDRQRH